jgi:hypothetical protein
VTSGPEEPAEAASSAGPVQPGARKTPGSFTRRLVAAITAGVLVALVACDQWVAGVRSWWDHRSFTTDVVSSLLVLAVTVLIIDEVLARRQRKDRAVSVAVQGLIVYDQAWRTYESVMSSLQGGKVDEAHIDEARDGVRSLASMILVASPSLFDDPEARLFLEELQRLTAWLYRAAALFPAKLVAAGRFGEQSVEAHLKASKARLDARIAPLAARLPRQDRSPFDEDPDQNTPATLTTATGGRTDRG